MFWNFVLVLLYPPVGETLSLYGGQLDRIRRTLFGWQTSRATAVQDAATFHRENHFPWPNRDRFPFLFLIETQLHEMPLVQSNRRQIARTNRFCHPRSLIFLKTTIRIPIIQKSRSLVIIFIPLLFFVFLLASIQDNGMLLQKSRCLFYRTRNVRLLLFHTTLLLTRYFIGSNVCAQSVWWTRPLKIRSPFASFRPCLRPFVSVTKKKMEKKRGGEKGSSRRLQSGK